MEAQAILEAKNPFEIFGELGGGDSNEQRSALGRVYRPLATEFHPDVNPGFDDVFDKLTSLRDSAQKAIDAGRYGKVSTITFKTSRGLYEVGAVPAFSGHSSDYFRGDLDGDGCLVKLVRSPTANSLLTNEATAISKILITEEGATNPEFFPQFLEAFTVRSGGKVRKAIAFADKYTLVSLEQVLDRYPAGVDPRDMAWMFRRILIALHIVAPTRVVHGALLPEHILIEPDKHGVVLIDWKHSVSIGQRIRSIPKGRKDWYPKDVRSRKSADQSVDIYMAAKCMVHLMGGEMALPSVLRAFFRGCSQEESIHRPESALSVLQDFDALIERMWGPRRFRPFKM